MTKVQVDETFIRTHLDDIIFVELKTTKKLLKNNPYGFFFGATEKEFNLARELGSRFRFCFVCLHPAASPSYKMLTMDTVAPNPGHNIATLNSTFTDFFDHYP